MGTKTSIVAGMVLGAISMDATLPLVPDTNAYKYTKAIAKCESELPRNQACEIYARPIKQGLNRAL